MTAERRRRRVAQPPSTGFRDSKPVVLPVLGVPYFPAVDLALSRILKHAEQVGAEMPDAAFDLLRTGRADALASNLPVLLAYSTKLPGSRVLEDRYGANLGTMAVSKDQPGRLTYFSEFIEEAKASGLVQQAIERGGQRATRVAPPGNPK